MFSFSKELKLRNFKSCFDNSQKYYSNSLVLYIKKSEELKLGIIVSKKVDKRAVVRNSIKRKLREAFRLNKPANGEMIVIAKKNVINMTYEDIAKDLQYLYKKFK